MGSRQRLPVKGTPPGGAAGDYHQGEAGCEYAQLGPQVCHHTLRQAPTEERRRPGGRREFPNQSCKQVGRAGLERAGLTARPTGSGCAA